MRKIFTLLFTISFLATFSQSSPRQFSSFTSGNLVVYRVGDSSAALRNYSAHVFLDEYSPAGILVQSIPMPAAGVSTVGLVAQGTAVNEGMINRSANGKYLLFGGYNADTGIASISTISADTVARVIGRIDVTGNYSLNKLGRKAFNKAAIRSIASTNGDLLYYVGGNSGVLASHFGDTTSYRISATGVDSTTSTINPSNFRAVNIYNGQLYASTSAGNTFRLVTIGTGLPQDTGSLIRNLPGIPSTGAPNQFFFADLNTSVSGLDVLYIADNGPTTGGVHKYSLVNGSWVSNGTVSPGLSATVGLTGIVIGGSVILYMTATGSGASALYSSVDASGYNNTIAGAPALLAVAPANTAFRGVALAPVLGLVPVKLISFNAALVAEGTKVNWKASNEVNVKGYTVERSVDGRNYTALGTVAAANRTEGNYSFMDKNVAEGINYYRLKMTDADGSFKYSNIATVNNRSVIKAEIYPNPATDNIVVKHSKAIAGATITITNAEGQQVRRIAVQQGTAQTGVIVDDLAKGNYILLFDNNGEKSVVKFVKQ